MIKNQNKELLKETIDRINQYEKHAIDGIFIPGLKNKEFISTIARNISVPLNIMLGIQSDKLEEYLSIGISRISFGPSTFLEFNHTNFTVEDYFKQKIDQISYLENNKLINLAGGRSLIKSENQKQIYYNALIKKDTEFDGVFFAGIKTTGIFCHPSCTARKPKFENCEFYQSAEEALLRGYRPCKVCHPLSYPQELPTEVKLLVEAIEQSPEKNGKIMILNC